MAAPYAEAQVDIEAPIERVWQVMIDMPRYGEWNPFIVQVGLPSGVRVGADLMLHVAFANGMRVKNPERILRLDAPAAGADGVVRACLEYQSRGPLHALNLVRASRPQLIERLGDGRTRYRTHETFGGLLARAVPLKQVQDGFERHAAALKRRCESPGTTAA